VFYYLIALAVILIDQVTKWMIVKEMYYGQSITVIENFLYITSHRNRGAAWCILQAQRWILYLITVVVVVGLIIYIQKLKKQDKWFGIALALMLGGAIGNFIDRVVRKEVVDFVNTYIFTYDFPIFNVADSALVVGVIIMFIMTLFEGKMKKEHKE